MLYPNKCICLVRFYSIRFLLLSLGFASNVSSIKKCIQNSYQGISFETSFWNKTALHVNISTFTDIRPCPPPQGEAYGWTRSPYAPPHAHTHTCPNLASLKVQYGTLPLLAWHEQWKLSFYYGWLHIYAPPMVAIFNDTYGGRMQLLHHSEHAIHHSENENVILTQKSLHAK